MKKKRIFFLIKSFISRDIWGARFFGFAIIATRFRGVGERPEKRQSRSPPKSDSIAVWIRLGGEPAKAGGE